MQVELIGILKFRGAKTVERAMQAFDDESHREFYDSRLFDARGRFVTCRRTFESEADCEPTGACLAMARLASDGCIEWRFEGDKEFVRLVKIPRPTTWYPSKQHGTRGFGTQTKRFEEQWADELAAADEAAAKAKAKQEARKKKAAKSGRKGPCEAVVELPGAAREAIRLRDGSLAVIAGTDVVFVSSEGKVTATVGVNTEEYDQFFAGASGLCELADGRVLAFQELTVSLRICGREDGPATNWDPPGEHPTHCNQSIAAWGDGFIAQASRMLYLDDGHGNVRSCSPWEDDYLRGAVPWRDGVLVWTMSSTAFVDAEAEVRWRVDGGYARVCTDEAILVRTDDGVAGVSAEGKVLSKIDVSCFGDVMPVVDGEVIVPTYRNGVARVSPTQKEARWEKNGVLAVMRAAPVLLPGGRIAVYAEPPFVINKDTSVVVLDVGDGSELCRVDAKAEVLGLSPYGDDGFALWVDGRSAGKKVQVFRGVSGKPRRRNLEGHTGAVRGVLGMGDGRLVSWGDRTLRFWRV